MRIWMRCAALGVLVATIAGCNSTTLLQAKFEGSGTPAGNIAGPPSGDSISVDISAEPDEDGGLLYWRPPPYGKARFRSAPYGSPTTTKTIFWEGKRTAGDT